MKKLINASKKLFDWLKLKIKNKFKSKMKNGLKKTLLFIIHKLYQAARIKLMMEVYK